MIRTLIFGLLLAAFLGQGWAQASMPPAGALSPQPDCMEEMSSDAGCDCCPDGATASGACASACSAALALTTVAPEVVVSRSQFDSAYVPPARAGPRYLPLNPPPIA